MSKDPAFLFYSQDFYAGTRTMLPEERGVYIDLLIYQHQNDGYITTDLRRLSMFCSGSDEAMLKAVLEAKFKLCDKGWYNEKLAIIVEERKEFSSRQSVNGSVGQFFKKAKSILKAAEYRKIKEFLDDYTNEEKVKIIEDYKAKNQANLQAMLQAMLKHLEDENEDENEDVVNDVFLNKREQLFKIWTDYKKEKGSTYKKIGLESLKKQWSDKTDQQLEDAINHSMSNGYQGLFMPKPQQNNQPQQQKPLGATNQFYRDPTPEDDRIKRMKSQINLYTAKVKKDYVLGVNYTENDLQDYLEKKIDGYLRNNTY